MIPSRRGHGLVAGPEGGREAPVSPAAGPRSGPCTLVAAPRLARQVAVTCLCVVFIMGSIVLIMRLELTERELRSLLRQQCFHFL